MTWVFLVLPSLQGCKPCGGVISGECQSISCDVYHPRNEEDLEMGTTVFCNLRFLVVGHCSAGALVNGVYKTGWGSKY